MRAKSLIAVAILIAAGASACGSSSKSPAAVGGTGTTSGTTSPSASGAPGGAPTTIKLSGSSGSNFCQLARADQAAFSPDLSNLGDLKSQYQNLGKALQDAANVAPSAIKGDFETFINAFKPFLQALADANYDATKVDTNAFKSLSSSQVEAASAHITQYFQQVCHISPPTT